MNRFSEYCFELNNYKVNGDQSVLNCPQTDTADDHPILRREVEAAVQSLKKRKSAGVDITPAELARSHDNLQQDLADRRIADPMDPVLSHHTSQERRPAAVSELPNNQPHQSHKHHRVDLQPKNPL